MSGSPVYDQIQASPWSRNNVQAGRVGPGASGFPPHVTLPSYAAVAHAQMSPSMASSRGPAGSPPATSSVSMAMSGMMRGAMPHPNVTISHTSHAHSVPHPQRSPPKSPTQNQPGCPSQQQCRSPCTGGSPGRVASPSVNEENPACAERQSSSIAVLRMKAKEHSVAMGMVSNHYCLSFLVVDSRSVRTTVGVGQNMQICHSLRCKQNR